MKKLFFINVVIFFLLFWSLFSFSKNSTKTLHLLQIREMKDIWAGWTCVNNRKCETNPLAPGGFTHCAHVNNYLKCFGKSDYTPCNACDEFFGGKNMYCIGKDIGITCWRQTVSCGRAYEGYCWNSICVATNIEIYPPQSCGNWDQCKNE
ncbi:MAG: hypothetical protein NC827_07280 [Candidatus Omnitrophica bacterium]|nr:hypothetical protein [Candidatus Omnitrophota bacterium]